MIQERYTDIGVMAGELQADFRDSNFEFVGPVIEGLELSWPYRDEVLSAQFSVSQAMPMTDLVWESHMAMKDLFSEEGIPEDWRILLQCIREGREKQGVNNSINLVSIASYVIELHRGWMDENNVDEDDFKVLGEWGTFDLSDKDGVVREFEKIFQNDRLREAFVKMGSEYVPGTSNGGYKRDRLVELLTKITNEKMERPVVVDLGCGSGRYSTWLADNTGAYVVGVDRQNYSWYEEARGQENTPEVAYLIHDARDTIIPNKGADVVLIQAVGHHVPEYVFADILREAMRVVVPEEGLIIVGPQGEDWDREEAVNDGRWRFFSVVEEDGRQVVVRRFFRDLIPEIKFGLGAMDLKNLDVLEATDKEKAEFFGYRVGCPIVLELIGDRGARAREMAERYGEVLFWYGDILKKVKKVSWNLGSQIEEKIKRNPGEDLVGHDADWIPKWNEEEIPGPETPWGYALPRLVTSYIHEPHLALEDDEDAGVRMSRAMDILDVVLEGLSENEGANELLVRFAERLVVQGKADPEIVLRKTISKGKYEQDNMRILFTGIVTAMREEAPVCWSVYQGLSTEKKNNRKIADVEARDLLISGRYEHCDGGEYEVLDVVWGVVEEEDQQLDENEEDVYLDATGFERWRRTKKKKIRWLEEGEMAARAKSYVRYVQKYDGKYPDGTIWVRLRSDFLGQSRTKDDRMVHNFV